jgi:hypothetical protein
MQGLGAMNAILRYAAQALLYALFALVIGVFGQWPPMQLLAADQGLLRLSFMHPGKPLAECRQRSPEELAKMPPQMRSATECPRERSPVEVRVIVDGRVVVDEAFAPGGLSRDGPSAAYRRLPLPAGEHRLQVRVSDDARRRQQAVERDERISIAPGQVVLIDYNDSGIVIR